MEKRIIVMFPYSGYDSGSPREEVFKQIVSRALNIASQPVTIVLNRDTEESGKADAFLEWIKGVKQKVDIHPVWSVDTCQMWLSGWGKVLDDYKGLKDNDSRLDDRIIQLPGDIDAVEDKIDSSGTFFNNLESFINLSGWDIIVGDFNSGNIFNAKELIDLYGTYALMANWFPEVAQQLRQGIRLNKSRSEFLNIRASTLRELLFKNRKFAYEQTLNMLINSWDFDNKEWKNSIHAHELGTLNDDGSFRHYSDCLDQIERTERMLKVLWREKNKKILQENPQEFIDRFDRYDRRSTSIRDNARIIIRNILRENVIARS